MELERAPEIWGQVHYVSHGSPGGEYPSVCRAAVIAEVYPRFNKDETRACALVVFNPSGILFCDSHQDENDRPGGTWHWPDHSTTDRPV